MESSTTTAVELEQPDIGNDDQFVDIVKKLSIYITAAITQPSTFEQLRSTSYGNNIRTLVDHLVDNCTNPAIVNAVLTLKFHYSSLEPDDRGVNDARANACEIVAWRFLGRLSEADAVAYSLYELPGPDDDDSDSDAERSLGNIQRIRRLSAENERTSLLPQFRPNHHDPTKPRHGQPTPTERRRQLIRSMTETHAFDAATPSEDGSEPEDDPTSAFTGLNALEIAAVANAKKFLSQGLVQKIINGVWNGEITLWDSLSVRTVKRPKFYNRRTTDIFSRLRVPKYVKIFEALFFFIFLAIYYGVLVQRIGTQVSALEIILYVWLFAFAYAEMSEFIDAGLFYYADFWSSWDLAIILTGLAFLVTRVIGLATGNKETTEIAFDILSLEAIFLVPRAFSLLSLHPYFGVLLPCLKEMAKDFVKFMTVVLILYLGFLTTFILLARDTFTLREMSWILLKVFFGASFIGFDVMHLISPQLGPPLMIIFVILTNMLLITSLISLLSNSFSRVISHAREEYLYVYSVYVLEASTSNRLTHFYPPLNLIPLIVLRPLRVCFSAETIRGWRIALLKFTHLPFVFLIWASESISEWYFGAPTTTFRKIGPSSEPTPKAVHGQTRAPPFLPARRNTHRYTGPTTPITRGSTGRSEEGANEGVNEGLEAKVDELSAKIAELTAMILAQNVGAPGK